MPFRLGKLPPRPDSRTLQLANYLRAETAPRAQNEAIYHTERSEGPGLGLCISGQGTEHPCYSRAAKSALPPAPRSVDWTAEIPSWPMFSNDTLGDCTAAAAAHMIQCWTANAGDAFTPTNAQVIAAYSATGHYVPGNPATDRGAVELDVLSVWRQQGIAGHKIDAYVAFSPRNFEHTRQAINIFGGIYIGLALPLSAQNQNVWDVPPQETFLSRIGAFFRKGSACAAHSAKNLPRISAGFVECGLLTVTCGSIRSLHSESFCGTPFCRSTSALVTAADSNSTPQACNDEQNLSPHAASLCEVTPENLPRDAQSISDFTPGSWGGHAVPVLAYDSDTLTCITWGAKKRMTWEFFSRYCDESYAPLSPDWLNAEGKTPEGLNLAALQADLHEIQFGSRLPR